jgi:septal ring factor EnvC (AmiA/AmiB activator)
MTRLLAMLLLVLVPAYWSALPAQSRKELEDKRQQLIREIARANKQLKETRSSKAEAMEVFLAVKAQVTKRRQLVNMLREELSQTSVSIQDYSASMTVLNTDIQRLRSEYAMMLRAAYRWHLQRSWLALIFSADSMNHAFRRRQYMRQYDRQRRRQAALIQESQRMLAEKIALLEERKADQERLVSVEQEQEQLLRQELLEQDKVLKTLQASEQQQVRALEKREREHEKFNAAIEKVIREEMAQKRKSDREAALSRPARASGAPVPADNSAESRAFGATKGRLNWPLSSKKISRYFGTHPHPTFRGVNTTSNGIDITAAAGEEIKAVFEGKVVGVQFLPGHQHTVMLQHGAYYTVYANLAVVQVQRGEQVRSGQVMGMLGEEDFHFEIWMEKKRLNPVEWLKK